VLECGEALSGALRLVVEFAVAALGGSDLDGFGGVDGAVGLSDGELAVGGEFEFPAEFVDEVVVSAARGSRFARSVTPPTSQGTR
jgi:hypothetical protein